MICCVYTKYVYVCDISSSSSSSSSKALGVLFSYASSHVWTLFPILFSITSLLLLLSPHASPAKEGYNTNGVRRVVFSLRVFCALVPPLRHRPARRALSSDPRVRVRGGPRRLWIGRIGMGVGNDHRADRAPNDDSNEREQQKKAAFFSRR